MVHTERPGSWKPPLYAQSFSHHPLHPYWGNNRTFLAVNAELPTPEMIPYDTAKNSLYYQQFLEVYEKDLALNQEEKEAAIWWGDDPDVTFTPPGHSYYLATQAIRKVKPDLIKCAAVYAGVGMATADAFITCWKWKYYFFTERPNTFIPQFIDERWESFWPDPPFPSFPSGHAIQAAAAATILQDYFEPFTFTDSSHVGRERDELRDVDFVPRSFDSFWDVAQETADSRFYGGIHTPQDNQVGLEEGAKIGRHVNELKWKTGSGIMMRRLQSLIVSYVLFSLVANAQTPFKDVTAEAGIQHQFVVYEGMFGGGICVFDLNNDGFEDLFITGGMNDDVLYLNNGDGTFNNIYEGSGLEISKKFVTQGVAGADVNRDGWVDLFVTTITSRDSIKTIPRARNLLFLNLGDNTFEDATEEYRLDELYSFSTGANFGDINADGYPDLYVGNYFLEYEGELSAINDATIVGANQTAKGYLLLNKNGRYFVDAYADYGLDHRGFGFGSVFSDFDNDGDQDMVVNHDFGYKAVPSYLLENQYPKRLFKDISKETEMDLKINAMGAAVGDYDNNGLLDYFITNIRFNHFMVNQGPGKPFQEMAEELDMYYLSISWGANFADFDHDGDLDLYVSNGDLNPNCVPMADFYFENANGTFTEKARAIGVNDYGIGRGSVVFDLENDGDLDILVVNQKPVLDYPQPSFTKLFRNDSASGNWLKVGLVGIEAETHGIGSRIKIVTGDTRMIREVDGGGSSHLSQNSTIAHFGLGNASVVDSVIVTWIGGKQQILTDQAVNTTLTITEVKERGSKTWAITGGHNTCSLICRDFVF